jgi:hypothetical protein
MQGDFERVTFDPADAFASVLLQQGRLLLPADFNELGAILQNALRRYIVDVHGPEWPVGGFEAQVANEGTLKFTVTAGTYYLDGLRCHTEGFEYGKPQPYWSTPDSLDKLSGDTAIIYLDCWERHVSWLQNERLREVALGGLDTASRVQVVWQVRAESQALADRLDGARRALENQKAATGSNATLAAQVKAVEDSKGFFSPTINVGNADEILATIVIVARPSMTAEAKHDAATADPCAIAPDAEYRGRENQLYRVEIHKPGAGKEATFKWSRENGSVGFRVLDVVVGDKETHVAVESLGRDRRNGVCEGDWVELVDEDLEFGWVVTPLLQVVNVDVQRRVVTLKGKAGAPPDPGRHAILRRWDHRAHDERHGVLPVVESKSDSIELERGIRIRFTPGGYYSKGDYWLIPARVATGDIEWPVDKNGDSVAIEPHGITHHRAVLAVANKSGGVWKGTK